jgi:putative transposase
MGRLLLLMVAALRSSCRSRADLVLENLALRQQLAVLLRAGRRPRVSTLDRRFWVVLRRFWSRWMEVLVFVRPATVIRWHRVGFRLYWNWLSRLARGGRPGVPAEVRALVRRLVTENPTWGAPRVHGELRMLGFEVSERTVSRLMPRRPRNPEAVQRWMTFLRNHRDAIAAMDFFVVPTVTFRVLYVWFAIEHGRRRILHINVTDHPNPAWVSSSYEKRSLSTRRHDTSSSTATRPSRRRSCRR